MQRRTWLLVSVLLPYLSLNAQQWSGILSPARAVDWSAAGIPGGVPSGSWSQCGSTIQASTYGNGSSDATSAIQSALNSCAANHYVLLSAGTFRINTFVSIPSNVVLRGSGADQTILSAYGTSNSAVINMSTAEPGSSAVNITSGGATGSQSIVVSSAAQFVVGGYIHISELNDSSYVSNTGSGGTCTWCDGYWNGTRAKGQIVEVTSISGTTIGFTPALYTNYTRTPQAVPFSAGAKYAGLESLQIYGNNTGYSYDVYMSTCAYCWVKGIETNYVDGNGDPVWIQFGYRDEIRDSYFSSAYIHTTGGTENELMLAYKTSACLIENNIFERMQTSVNVAAGSAGNVIAYNLMTGSFDNTDASEGSMGAVYFHEAHPQFNLLEGNVLPTVYPDSVWGTSSQMTAFRNWATAETLTCTPLTGRGVVNCSGSNGTWKTEAARGMQIDGLSTSNNFVGNVVGSAWQQALGITKVASLQWPSGRAWDTETYGWTWGYTSLGDDGSNSLDSTNAYTTAFLHGNYNNIDGSLVWANGVTHTLPASFYRSSKPSWFGSSAWPAIGPDVTGSGPGNYTSAIPAQTCYSGMGGTEGGAGSPFKFNAAHCYYAVSAGAPVAPTALTAVAQ